MAARSPPIRFAHRLRAKSANYLLALSSVLFITSAIARADSHTGEISGTVMSEGKALSGARIIVYTAKPKMGPSAYCPSCYPGCGKQATSDANGGFHIAGLPDWLKFRLLVVGPGKEPAFIGKVDTVENPRILVELTTKDTPADKSNLIAGRIVDASGKPIAGATITPFGVDLVGGRKIVGKVPDVDLLAISDDDGEFDLRAARSKVGELAVFIEARDNASEIVQGLVPGEKTPEILMSAGTTVVGTVTARGGNPVAGAVIKIKGNIRSANQFTHGFESELATNADGRYSIANVPAGFEFNALASMESLIENKYTAPVFNGMTKIDGSTSIVDFHVVPGESITGRVTAIDNSKVPEHLRIILSRRNLGDSQFANVNSDGVFHFDAVPIGEDLSLSLGDRSVGMVGGTHTASGEYLLRASLDQGIRNFDIKVHAVDAEPLLNTISPHLS